MSDDKMNGNAQRDVEAMPSLTQVPTSVTLSAEQFEKLYLNPMLHRQTPLTRNLANPTPLAVGAYVLTAAPLACCLMGWRGAGGGGAAFTGVLILFGGLLLVLSSILEFIIGNTFPCVVFGHLGSFCLAFGASITPAFNSAAPYSPTTTSTVGGLHSPGFVNTYAFFFLFMAILMVIYMVCATRINVVFVAIFAALAVFFTLLAAGYWRLGLEDAVVGDRLMVGAGAALFPASMFGLYLLIAQLLDSVAFPVSLPIGDLSNVWGRRKTHIPAVIIWSRSPLPTEPETCSD